MCEVYGINEGEKILGQTHQEPWAILQALGHLQTSPSEATTQGETPPRTFTLKALPWTTLGKQTEETPEI